MEEYLDTYVKSLVKEIELFASAVEPATVIHTIYFGGGTPTIMLPCLYAKIIDAITRNFSLAHHCEITTEANPLNLTRGYLNDLRKIGLNRLSLGMQSAEASELELLGRRNSLIDVVQSVEFARRAGLDNINLDLIFGIPGQTLKSFQSSTAQALALEPQHLSVYSLTVEAGTPLQRMLRAGQIPPIDEELSADMYEWVMESLPEKSFQQYEISNWAVNEGLRCRHNLQYWHDQPYLGFGAGAHSYYGHIRWANTNAIPDYIYKLAAASAWKPQQPPASVEVIQLNEVDEMAEFMLMGLRLVEEGVTQADFQARFGKNLDEVYNKEIAYLLRNGLLEKGRRAGVENMHLTCRGRMLGNQVFLQFVRV